MDDFTLESLADIICGDDTNRHPVYRTGSELTRFFYRAGLPQFRHDGSTRKWWTLDALRRCSETQLESVIERLASPKEYGGDGKKVAMALKALNQALATEGLKVALNGVVPRIERTKPTFTLTTEEQELKALPPPDFLALGLEPGVGELLAARWDEAQRCLDAKAFLAATILMGSLLEGLLLAVCQRFPKAANQATCAPRHPETGKAKYFAEWTFAEMIEVAHALKWVGLDVKKFSHALREFRNLIHPYQQLQAQTFPDLDTCQISWLVVQAAANDLARVLQSQN